MKRLAHWTQDRWAGTAFVMVVCALLAWLGMVGHHVSRKGVWFGPMAGMIFALFLINRRPGFLLAGEASVALAAIALEHVSLSPVREAIAAAAALLLVLGFGAGKPFRFPGLGFPKQRLPREGRSPFLRFPRLRVPRLTLPLRAPVIQRKPQASPEPEARSETALPAATPAGNLPWSALAAFWEKVEGEGARLIWLRIPEHGELVAGVTGEPAVLESLLRQRIAADAATEVDRGFLTVRLRRTCEYRDIPDELRTLVPVGSGAEGQIWVCLAGRNHVLYAGEASPAAAALRAAAVALVAQMKGRARFAVYDPGYQLAGIRREVQVYSSGSSEFREWLTSDLYSELMERLASRERAGSSAPWWFLFVGDTAELEDVLEVILARGGEASTGLLAVVSPSSRLIRLAETLVCFRMSEAESWAVLGHPEASRLSPDQVIISLEAKGGTLRIRADRVYVEDSVITEILDARNDLSPEEDAAATPPSQGSAGPNPQIRAVLRVVFNQGRFGVRSVYQALGGQVSRDALVAIGAELERCGIVEPSRGRAGRAVVKGITLQEAERRWMSRNRAAESPPPDSA